MLKVDTNKLKTMKHTEAGPSRLWRRVAGMGRGD